MEVSKLESTIKELKEEVAILKEVCKHLIPEVPEGECPECGAYKMKLALLDEWAAQGLYFVCNDYPLEDEAFYRVNYCRHKVKATK